MNDLLCKLRRKQVEINRREAVPLFATPASSDLTKNGTKTGERRRSRMSTGLGDLCTGRQTGGCCVAEAL